MLQIVLLAQASIYRFNRLKSTAETKAPVLAKVIFPLEDKADLPAVENALQQGIATACGMNVAKDLGNLAPNICTPGYLAEQAKTWPKSIS